jgi:hypothetical protein
MKVNKLLQLLRDNARNSAEAPATIRAESTDTEVHLYVYDVIDKWWGASADMLSRRSPPPAIAPCTCTSIRRAATSSRRAR